MKKIRITKKELTKRDKIIVLAVSVIAAVIAFAVAYHISFNHFSDGLAEDGFQSAIVIMCIMST